MSHPQAARKAPRPVAVQCGSHDEEWMFEGKHPVVRRLWNAVAEHFTLDNSFNEKYPGFKAMVRSLATPCAVLYDARKAKHAHHAAPRPFCVSGGKSDSDRTSSTTTPPVRDRVSKRNGGVDGQWREFERSFVGSIEFLCTLDWHVDEHWTVVKYHVAVLEQRAVGDVGCGSGHVILALPASMEVQAQQEQLPQRLLLVARYLRVVPAVQERLGQSFGVYTREVGSLSSSQFDSSQGSFGFYDSESH